jgi:hypothetical protein
MRLGCLALLVLLSTACGASQSSTRGAPGEVATETPSDAETQTASIARASLAALSPKSVGFVHIDGARVRKSALYAAYRQVLPLTGQDPLAEVKQSCGFDPLDELRALSIGLETLPAAGTGLAVAMFERPAKDAMECLRKIAPGDSFVATAAGELLIIGDSKSVQAAVARVESRAPPDLPRSFVAALDRDPSAAIVAAVDLRAAPSGLPARSGLLTLSSTDRRFFLHVEAELASQAQAKQLLSQLDVRRYVEESAAESKLPAPDLGKHKSWTEGTTVFYEISVDDDLQGQTRVLMALSALGIYGVRHYLARSKEAEARYTVAHIAKLLAEHVRAQPPHKAKLPASAPRTPASVPSGKKTLVEVSTWSHPTWKAIGFSMQDPVYYSYEIATAKGGRSATVRATGDLDGDGVLSRYSLIVKLDAKGAVTISPDLLVENALE